MCCAAPLLTGTGALEAGIAFMNMTRPSMPLNEDLRVFLTVVRKQNFARAAVELGVSPAYISKRMNILSSLNVRLFHRTTRSIVLTEEGESPPLGAADPQRSGRLYQRRDSGAA